MSAPSASCASSQRPIVIKIGGVALEDQRHSPALWRALLALHATTPVVLVHGGGRAVDRLIERLGLPTQRRDGIRITPPDQMDAIAGVLAGSVNKSLVGAINAALPASSARPLSGPAVGLCVGDGASLRTRKATKYPFDAGRVGEVVGGDGALMRTLFASGFLPVVSSIGLDDRGELLNINADDAAAGLAGVLNAQTLVLLTDVAGVKDASGAILPTLSAELIDGLVGSGVIAGGMVPKVRAALAIATELSIDVTIMSGQETHALEAWARGDRVGTRILSPATHRDSPRV